MIPDFDTIRSEVRGGRYTKLGYGAGRSVYDMNTGYVVKVAKNRFGLRQNRNESELSLRYHGDLLARVAAVSEGYEMLVMQTATPLHDMGPVLRYFNIKNLRRLTAVPELNALVREHRLVMKEFLGARNWGLINNRPVIIDYGFARRRRTRGRLGVIRF